MSVKVAVYGPGMVVATAWALILVGAVWLLQGLDVPWAPQSFMTGDPWWAVGGALGILIGVGLLWDQRRRRS
jgi:hypothetical protein